jgi:hypothetical protein
VCRERTIQFFVLGGLAFALAPRHDDTRIHLSHRMLEARRAAYAVKAGESKLSEAESEEVDRRSLEDEVLYREALRLGLDRGDAILKQHLIQKMLLVAEDLAGASSPVTEADLRAYFEATRSRRVHAARLSFVHAFASTADRAEALEADIAKLPASDVSAPPLGDPFPVPRSVSKSRAAIAAEFGETFASQLEVLPVGTWSRPIPSRYGYHFVRLLEREAERPATFEEVRDALRLEYQVDRRQRAVADFLTKAFARYQTDIDGVATSLAPSGKRVGVRTESSQED